MSKFEEDMSASPGTKNTSASTQTLRLSASYPMVLILASMILSTLCLCAGQGIMQEYAVFTLDMSDFGVGIKRQLDQKLEAAHLRRAQPLRRAVITGPLPNRFDIGHAIRTGLSTGRSKLGSIESQATGALQTGKGYVIGAVDDAYDQVIDDLDLQSRYNFYPTITCTNVDGHNSHCTNYKPSDPLHALMACYAISVLLVLTSLVISIYAIRYPTTRAILFSTWFAIAAFCGTLISSALALMLAWSTAKLMELVAPFTGIKVEVGGRFLILTWITVALLFATMLLWIHIRRKTHGG